MAKRTAIYVSGFAHKNPVPAACQVGNMVFSGGIRGVDPQTGETAETLEE
jgi:2-iminobutanoate/2-iminopropanoate deaminase